MSKIHIIGKFGDIIKGSIIIWLNFGWASSLKRNIANVPETHGEAYNRILNLLIRDAILNHDQKTFVVRFLGTDVMIILLSFLQQFVEYSPDVRIYLWWLETLEREVTRTSTVSTNYITKLVSHTAWVYLSFMLLQGVIQPHHFFDKSKKKFFLHWTKSEHTQDVTLAFQ